MARHGAIRGSELPSVVLGCATFGGVGSIPELLGRGVDRDNAFALMDAAWASGIRWFDTADAYGGGLSESWIGAWIEERGRRPRLTTKTYNPMSSTADIGLSRDRIFRQVASSLERLQVDRIDLYLAHEFDERTPPSETIRAFEELVEQDCIGAYGVSNFTASQIEQFLSEGRPSVVQNSFSILTNTDALDVIPLTIREGLIYQAYSPLAGGWLSGKYRRGESPDLNARLKLVPQWYSHIDEHAAFHLLSQLDDLSESTGFSVAALAMYWVSAHPGVASIIVGPKKVDHLAPVWDLDELGREREVGEQLDAIVQQWLSAGR